MPQAKWTQYMSSKQGTNDIYSLYNTLRTIPLLRSIHTPILLHITSNLTFFPLFHIELDIRFTCGYTRWMFCYSYKRSYVWSYDHRWGTTQIDSIKMSLYN